MRAKILIILLLLLALSLLHYGSLMRNAIPLEHEFQRAADVEIPFELGQEHLSPHTRGQMFRRSSRGELSVPQLRQFVEEAARRHSNDPGWAEKFMTGYASVAEQKKDPGYKQTGFARWR